VSEIYAVGHAENAPGAHPFGQLLAVADGPRLAPRMLTDTAVIVYTSGTTGRPKGAELIHIQLYMNADIPGRLVGVQPDDVVITVLPLFHMFGLSSILNLCVRFGCTMSLIPRFENRFGVVILEGYGLTETASTMTQNKSITERRAYSVGKPIWGTQTQVWDDDGNALPPGKDHVGEVVTRGLHVMKGYLHDPQATAEAFAGGWFHTGDLGYVDEDGFLFIAGRSKELIIRGGYNVYPAEIEDVLHAHPAIAEAAVIGIPDDRLGEEVMAVVTLRPGASLTAPELIAYCKERIAAYKYPRVIEFRDELPKNAMGKIMKDELIPR
jgi:long-chain acyl-CoA synthetase